jgi:AraC family transcriptional regulator
MTQHAALLESPLTTASMLQFPSGRGPVGLDGPGRLWLDRGESRVHVGAGQPLPRLVALSRSACASVAIHQVSFWLVLRGEANVQCREGRFRLETGAWIALEHDSQPMVDVDPHALVVAVLLPASGPMALERNGLPALLPGIGRIGLRERRLAFAHWRRAGVFATGSSGNADVDALKGIVHFLSGLQHALTQFLPRCPGRALWRRRLVLARMQCVSLYLGGNLDRNVPLSELAELSHFSTWHVRKTFQSVYGLGPREMAAGLRLRLAAELLAGTDLSIAEVGIRCGFHNACSFARAFRSHYGSTASAYRLSRGPRPLRHASPTTASPTTAIPITDRSISSLSTNASIGRSRSFYTPSTGETA